MSVLWDRPPSPRRRRPCRHWQCAYRRLASAFLFVIAGSAITLFEAEMALGTWAFGWLTTGALAIAAGITIRCWPHPSGDDEALIRATRECRACSPADIGPAHARPNARLPAASAAAATRNTSTGTPGS